MQTWGGLGVRQKEDIPSSEKDAFKSEGKQDPEKAHS